MEPKNREVGQNVMYNVIMFASLSIAYRKFQLYFITEFIYCEISIQNSGKIKQIE